MRPYIFIAAALMLAGCGSGGEPSSDGASSAAVSYAEASSYEVVSSAGELSSAAETAGYRQITQEEAAEMMTRDDGHIIVDVRRQDEFDGGHIPGAVLIPNESITDTPPEKLPDKQQIILVYCRSGRRSKEAAQKLADMGYTNVYEFGGIITWKGETVTE